MSKNKFPKSLIVTNVKELVIRDILESKWLEWWDHAEPFDCVDEVNEENSIVSDI